MTEFEQILLLQRWDDFLAAQGVYFDARIVELQERPHVPDEENVAFLQVDERLAKPAIEKAVAAFIRDGSWPTLGYRECLHLTSALTLRERSSWPFSEAHPKARLSSRHCLIWKIERMHFVGSLWTFGIW